MRYEIATLDVRLGATPKVVAGIDAAAKAAASGGALLGCWISEIGALNQIYVLRSFPDDVTLQAERTRLLSDANPFGFGEGIARMDFETYVPFPWCSAPKPGRYGAVYEIRTYRLKHGGLAPTIAAWEAAMSERSKYSPLTIVMSAIDGEPRFTHIWPYESLEHRAKARSDSVKDGAWPPKGGPDWLTGDMRSTIALPASISPLA